MRKKMDIAILVVALAIVGVTPNLLTAQVSLEDQLKAQYSLAKMGSDSSGYSVVQEGTLLKVQKGGIIGVPYKNMSTRTATFKDGTVHASDPTSGASGGIAKFGCGLLHKCPTTPDQIKDETATKLFKVGDKVYPEKIAVNLAKDSVILGIVACDTCNNTDPPTYNKAQVVFQFPSGTLAKASAPQVEDTISALLAIDEGGDQNQGGNGNNQQGNQGGGGGGGNGGGGGQQAQQGPPPEPQQIEKGQTPDQVKAALGQPEKIVNLGAKQLYVYHDIKVTFVNGKVADVQ